LCELLVRALTRLRVILSGSTAEIMTRCIDGAHGLFRLIWIAADCTHSWHYTYLNHRRRGQSYRHLRILLLLHYTN